MAPGIENVDHELPLLGGKYAQHAVLEQFGATDDGIERRSEFVRHVGKEGGFRPVCRSQNLMGIPHRRLCLSLLGYIPEDQHRPSYRT